MFKWKLLIRTLPMVGGVLAVALTRDYVMHFKGIIEFADVAPPFSAVALIVGFMLAGVLTDYKESEKVPGEIANTLETIGDTVHVVVAVNKDADVSEFENAFRKLVSTVEDWFMRRTSKEQCYAAINEFRQVITTMHDAGGVNYTIRCLGETHNLRRLVTRVDVISQTSFMPVGYALLDLLVGSTLILLLISSYKNPIAEYSLITLFSLIYLYLVRLIREIDSPFSYASLHDAAGSVAVDPYPLNEYRKRVEVDQSTVGTVDEFAKGRGMSRRAASGVA